MRALDMRTYLGRRASARRSRPIPDCVRVITLLPYVFYGPFPVDLDRLRTLAYALTVGGLYAMAEDKLIDSQSDRTLVQTLLVPNLYSEFIRTLVGIFPASSEFWLYHDRFFREYQMAEIAHDQETGRAWRVHRRKYYRIAKAKAAPMKLALCGMAILSRRRNQIGRLLRSFDYWIIGNQLYDDVADWQEDHLACRQSLIGTGIRHLIASVRASGKQYRSSELSKIVHSSDVMESMLEESGRWFAKAAKAAGGLQCDDWMELLRIFNGLTSKAVQEMVTLKVGILFGD